MTFNIDGAFKIERYISEHRFIVMHIGIIFIQTDDVFYDDRKWYYEEDVESFKIDYLNDPKPLGIDKNYFIHPYFSIGIRFK